MKKRMLFLFTLVVIGMSFSIQGSGREEEPLILLTADEVRYQEK